MLAGLLARCSFPPAGAALTCAVSGGPDSLALLVLAVEAGCTVTAVHVDHGIRAGSAAEAEVVSAAAARLGASFRSETVVVEPGPNLEARARAARWGVLPEDAATGHTADDQAETVLLNLMRGAGLDGAAAMAPGPRHPILELRRSETTAVCAHAGLEPFHDPTNDDRRFRRNRVRHEVIPLLSDIAGRDVVPLLCRSAGLARVDAGHLDADALTLDPTDAAALAAAPEALARRAVRRWLADTGPSGYPPDAAAVARVLAVAAKATRAADVGEGVRIRRRAGRLLVEREAEPS